LSADEERISLGFMPRKPTALRGSFDEVTIKVAEMIDLEVDARVGPNATFEEQKDAATAIAAEVAAELEVVAARRAAKTGA
jgi:hypothetical protein